MARKQVFSYPQDDYSLNQLKEGKLTTKQMRQEYKHLRDVANKRLKRLEKSDFAEYNIYIKRKYEFIPLSKIHTERDLVYRLAELADFIADEKRSTLTGLKEARKEAVTRAQEKGLYFITEKNVDKYGRYMDFLRQLYTRKALPSEEAAELFRIAEEKGIEPEEVAKDFDYWRENIEELDKTKKIKNKNNVSAKDYRKEIEKKNKKR